MEDYDDLITSLSRKKHNTTGEYSINTTLISLNFNDFVFDIPYNLTKKEFKKNFNEIEKALTYYHEMCHSIHYLSTTNCILHFFSITQETNSLLMNLPLHKIKLPISNFYREIESKILNNENLSDNEYSFFTVFFTNMFFSENARWLQGTLEEDGLFFRNYQKQPLLNGIAYSLNFYNDVIKSFESEITSKEYGYYRNHFNNNFNGLGVLHLCESFAKSVEIEHLARLNEEISLKIVNNCLNDKNVLDDNLPFLLFIYMSESDIIKNNKWNKLGFLWVHMRLFIDISLMYSDFLFIEPKLFITSIFKYTLTPTIQPGITFIKVLEAFDKCTPLKNNKDDILRLYDDICTILNIPSLKQMINKLIELLKLCLEINNVKTSASAYYLYKMIQMLELKSKNPILFINDLIYSDKFTAFNDILRGFTAYKTPIELYGKRSGFLMLEYLYSFTHEVMHNYPIKCSYDLTLNKVEGKPKYSNARVCFPKKEKYNDCSKCPVSGYIEYFEINVLN